MDRLRALEVGSRSRIKIKPKFKRWFCVARGLDHPTEKVALNSASVSSFMQKVREKRLTRQRSAISLR